MHANQIHSLAHQFKNELQDTGVDETVLARLAAQAVENAVQSGTHMSIQDVWLAAGGNPGMTPSKDDVTAALRICDEAVNDCDRLHSRAAVEQAVHATDLHYYGSTPSHQIENRAAVAKLVAARLHPRPEVPAVDSGKDTLPTAQAMTRAQWISRYVDHLVGMGHVQSFALQCAESSYGQEESMFKTPEKVAAEDLAGLTDPMGAQ